MLLVDSMAISEFFEETVEKSAMINIILVAANKDMANLVRASTVYVVTTDNLLAERAKTGTLTRKMVRPAVTKSHVSDPSFWLGRAAAARSGRRKPHLAGRVLAPSCIL